MTEYHKSTGGWPQSQCKACHRISSNDNRRKRYATNGATRRKERARVNAYYKAHPEVRRAYYEANAEKLKAYSRAWRRARKLRNQEKNWTPNVPTAGPEFQAKIRAALRGAGRPRKTAA